MNAFYWWCSEWIEVLRDDPREFVDVEGVLACARYGYSLLLGEEFDEVYGPDVCELGFFDRVNSHVIGSVLYYRWNTIVNGGVLHYEDIDWFIHAFLIMREHSVASYYDVGVIDSIALVTDLRRVGAFYEVGVLIKQALFISYEKVAVVDYRYRGVELFDVDVREFDLSVEVVKYMLGEFSKNLKGGIVHKGVVEYGSWELRIGDVVVSGALGDYFIEMGDLDGMIRMALGDDRILGFGGIEKEC